MVFDPADLLIKLVTSETLILVTKHTHAISAVSPGYFLEDKNEAPMRGRPMSRGFE